MNNTIKIRKEVLGLTQLQMAKATNRTQAAVSYWEKRGVFPSVVQPTVRNLCKDKLGNKWDDAEFFNDK